MIEESVTQTFTVQGRPVGYAGGRFGGSLVALERGHFPMSPTGYWSLSGLRGERVTQELLESLAQDRDEETRAVLRAANFEIRAGPSRVGNYIHASMTAEKAFRDGFFATDMQRRELWPAAFRLLTLIDQEEQFQPVPSTAVWNAKQCQKSMAHSRKVLTFLRSCAKGELPEVPETRKLLTWLPCEYLRLPPRKGGEPVVLLPAIATELALKLPVTTDEPALKPRSPHRHDSTPFDGPQEAQLGLFGTEDAGPAMKP
jgi:hypothetical protein